MAIKEFTIEDDGQTYNVKIEDKLSFGVIKRVLNESVNLKDFASGKIDIKPDVYLERITQAAIVEPLEWKSQAKFEAVPWTVVDKVMDKVSELYPLADFLSTIGRKVGKASQQTINDLDS